MENNNILDDSIDRPFYYIKKAVRQSYYSIIGVFVSISVFTLTMVMGFIDQILFIGLLFPGLWIVYCSVMAMKNAGLSIQKKEKRTMGQYLVIIGNILLILFFCIFVYLLVPSSSATTEPSPPMQEEILDSKNF